MYTDMISRLSSNWQGGALSDYMDIAIVFGVKTFNRKPPGEASFNWYVCVCVCVCACMYVFVLWHVVRVGGTTGTQAVGVTGRCNKTGTSQTGTGGL